MGPVTKTGVLVCVAAAALSVLAPRVGGQDQEDHAWRQAESVEAEAWWQLTSSLPTGATLEPGDWAARILADDGWSRTGAFVVTKRRGGAVAVAYVRLDGDNLLGQLHGLYASAPDLALPEALTRLAVRRGELGSDECGPLKALAAQLGKLREPVLPEDYLALHAPGYELTVSLAFRPDRQLLLDAGEGEAAAWCAAVVKAVVQCEGKRAARSPGR